VLAIAAQQAACFATTVAAPAGNVLVAAQIYNKPELARSW
jgi:hypothetical protein